MRDFKEIIKAIQETIKEFSKQIPKIQSSIVEELQNSLSELDVRSGNVKVSASNLRVIAKIKNRLQEIILSPEYKKAVKKYIEAFEVVTILQHQYFKELSNIFKPPKLSKELRKQAIKSVVASLTESGLEANVLAGIDDILRTNITTGGSYSSLSKQLNNFIVDNGNGDGILTKYTNQITTDSINQYSAQYTQLISNDLGYEWFIYAGSNIETSRPFCLACTKKRFIHISEIPALLKGDFPEFKEFDGKLYKGLPAGMFPDTTTSNFQIKRGGYNCGHQLRPISDFSVPEEVKIKFQKTNKK